MLTEVFTHASICVSEISRGKRTSIWRFATWLWNLDLPQVLKKRTTRKGKCLKSDHTKSKKSENTKGRMQTRTRIFVLSQTFISHTHGGDGVSQSRLPLLLPKCPEKPDSYLRVIAMGMGLSRTWLAQAATSFHRLRISLSAKKKIKKRDFRREQFNRRQEHQTQKEKR